MLPSWGLLDLSKLAVIFLGGMLALLEYSFADLDVLSMHTDVGDVSMQWLTMSTTNPQVEQTLTWSDNHEPYVQTKTGFRMSLTVDVTVDSDGSMAFSLVNEADFCDRFHDVSQVRDVTTDGFHRTRMRAVGLANNALLTAGVDLGDNSSGRQLQQSNVDNMVQKEQNVVADWLHKLANSSFHPLSRHSKMHVFATMMACVSAVMCMLLPCMVQGRLTPPHPSQHGLRTNVRKSDAGPPFVGTAIH